MSSMVSLTSPRTPRALPMTGVISPLPVNHRVGLLLENLILKIRRRMNDHHSLWGKLLSSMIRYHLNVTYILELKVLWESVAGKISFLAVAQVVNHEILFGFSLMLKTLFDNWFIIDELVMVSVMMWSYWWQALWIWLISIRVPIWSENW